MITVTDWVQIAAVLVAVGAAVSALVIATVDRKTQLRIARHQAMLSRLSIELEYAVRLAANRAHGGSTDPMEVKRLGAEAMALTSVVGKRWAPLQYERTTDGKTPDELRVMLSEDEATAPQWFKDRLEAGLAVQAIVDALHMELEPKRGGWMRRLMSARGHGLATSDGDQARPRVTGSRHRKA